MTVVDRGLFVALALLWVALGVSSFRVGSVPLGGSGVWLLLTCIPAGTALAVARWQTRFALRTYLVGAGLVALFRSFLYLERGAASPLAVWLIVGTTTLLVYAELRDDVDP